MEVIFVSYAHCKTPINSAFQVPRSWVVDFTQSMVGFFRSGVCWGEGMLDLPGIIKLPILVIKWDPILGKIKLDVNMLLVNLLDLHPQPVANKGSAGPFSGT